MKILWVKMPNEQRLTGWKSGSVVDVVGEVEAAKLRAARSLAGSDVLLLHRETVASRAVMWLKVLQEHSQLWATSAWEQMVLSSLHGAGNMQGDMQNAK